MCRTVWLILCIAHTVRSTATQTTTATVGTVTETGTGTLPSLTVTTSYTGSTTGTTSRSETWTGTATGSKTPTVTGSLTDTTTITETVTLTVSPTVSATDSVTLSESVPSHDNYTLTCAPSSFVEGQEIRLSFTATLGDLSVPRFNKTLRENLEVRMLRMSGSYDCTSNIISTTSFFSIASSESEQGGAMALTALTTFTAPSASTKFYFCFRHTAGPPPMHQPEYHFEGYGKWLLFETDDGASFQSSPGDLWYYLPSPTVGQQAVVQFVNREEWNFTIPASNCWSHQASCAMGDNGKVVPRGEPCTYESEGTYLGSSYVNTDGSWKLGGLGGLLEGSTAGGAVALGTRTANPFTQTWTRSATFAEAGFETQGVQSLYGYLTLPAEGTYDVCYSAMENRRAWKQQNVTYATPMWRKVYRCEHPCHAKQDLSFTVASESIRWSAVDLAPGTWGVFRVVDVSGQGILTRKPSTTNNEGTTSSVFPTQVSATGDFWNITGSAFKLVPEENFNTAQTGSFSKPGCWAQLNTQYGWAQEDHQFPVATLNLHDDPTDMAGTGDNATGVNTAYASLWVPEAGRWVVCFRVGGGTPATGGYRRLPWSTDSLKWAYLNNTDGLVVPSITPKSSATATWSLADKRSMTWGPLHINATDIDVRPWNYKRQYRGSKVVDTVGTAVRVVPSGMGCHYDGRNASDPNDGAESVDGGLVECRSADADTGNNGCVGSEYDGHNGTSFYITVPGSGRTGSFDVCWRNGAGNWRKLAGVLHIEPDPMATGSIQLTGPTSNLTIGQLAMYIVSDSSSKLTSMQRTKCPSDVPCSSTGDIMRIVDMAVNCDIIPSQQTSAEQFDTYLSMYCPATAQNQTGLTNAPCSADPVVMSTYCAGQDCSTVPDSPNLLAMVSVTPPLVFNVAPYETSNGSNLSNTAAVFKLPKSGNYKLCYKQAWSDNWLIVASGLDVVSGAQSTLLPRPNTHLLSGEVAFFELRAAIDDRPDFYARIVKAAGTGECANPPEGTEATVFESATKRYEQLSSGRLRFGLIVPHSYGEHTVCISTKGANTSTWESWGPYTVVDNEVRWFVEADSRPTNQGLSKVQLIRCKSNPDAQNCSFSDATGVFQTSPGEDSAKLITLQNSNGTHQACYVPSDSDGLLYGQSGHVGINTNEITDLGPANGPADIAQFIAVLPSMVNDSSVQYKVCVKTYFRYPIDRVAWVEVQEGTNIANQLHSSATGTKGFTTQSARLHSWHVDTRLQPHTNEVPAAIDSSNAVVALAGVSTQYAVGYETATNATPVVKRVGFRISSAEPLESQSIEFKLIASSRPTSSRYPTDGSWEWSAQEKSDCLAPAVDGTRTGIQCSEATGQETVQVVWESTTAGTNSFTVEQGEKKRIILTSFTAVNGEPVPHEERCFIEDGKIHAWLNDGHWPLEAAGVNLGNVTGVGVGTGCSVAVSKSSASRTVKCCFASSLEIETTRCPSIGGISGVTFDVSFTLPVSPGEYHVCARLNSSSPWLWLKSDTGSFSLYTQPPYLEFEEDNLYDTRLVDVNGVRASLAAWCYNCSDAAVFTHDLVKVVPDQHICPIPDTPNAEGWYKVLVVRDSRAVAEQGFELPPSHMISLGRFKVCLFKTGKYSGDLSDKWVSVPGVSYQLVNRGSTQTGGQSGYYQSATGGVNQLLVDVDLQYNVTQKFLTYTSDTQNSYESITPDALEEDGFVSSTAVIRSGTRVDVVLRAAHDGIPVPLGQFVVSLLKCPYAAGSWKGLSCANPLEQLDDFEVINVATGNMCTAEKGPLYGWPKTSLKQFIQAGVVVFRLQYMSGCPQAHLQSTLPNPGCGVRFAAKPQGKHGPLIYSPPIWINVMPHYPDGIAVDGEEVLPLVEICQSQCFVKRCRHYEECTLDIQARWKGPAEYSVLGDILIDPIVGNSSNVVASLNSYAVQWDNTGTYRHTFTPRLVNTLRDTGEFTFNISIGEQGRRTWTFFQVIVETEQPDELVLYHVETLDTRIPGNHIPTDPWFAVDGAAQTGDLTAHSDAFIEALVPYAMLFTVKRDGRALQNIYNWVITASVPSSQNAVLGVVVDSLGHLSVANRHTSSAYTIPFSATVPKKHSTLPNGDTLWSVEFRMLNNAGCLRWEGGCGIKWELMKANERLEATLQTAVRVPAATIHVLQTAFSSSVSSGYEVTTVPGTNANGKWMYDEFHNGEIFALLDATDETAELIGPAYHPVSPLMLNSGQQVMGARWTLQTNKPCISCHATFHSTWGAGPVESAGTAFFSMTSTPDVLMCEYSASTGVTYDENKATTVVFNMSAFLVDKTGERLSWPRDLVTIKAGDAHMSLSQTGGESPISKPLGERGVLFEGLFLRGMLAISEVTLILEVGSMGKLCSIVVPIERGIIPEPKTVMKVVRVDGGVPLCEGCLKYRTTTSDQVRVSVEFYYVDPVPTVGRQLNEIDGTGRNITVQLYQDGGVDSTPPWACLGSNHPCTTAGLSVTSQFPHVSGVDDGGVASQYTYGTAFMVFSRRQIDGVTGKGQASLTFEQKTQFKSPVRDFRFAVCASTMVGNLELVDTSIACEVLSFWVLPSASQKVSKSVAITGSTGLASTKLTPGAGTTCGSEGSLVGLTVLAYYTLSDDVNQKKYILYDTQVTYSLSTASNLQLFVEAKDGYDSGRQAVMQREMLKTNTVPIDNPYLHSEQVAVTFNVYGLLPLSAYWELQAVDNQMATPFMSTVSAKSYTWTSPPVTTGTHWKISDAVEDAMECPKRRYFEVTKHNYRAYEVVPGKGWSYSAEPLSVGLPFPIGTTVTSVAGRAHTFAASLVTVALQSWSGCNNGGDLVVHKLRNPAEEEQAVLLSGEAESFTTVTDGVLTEAGTANLWISLSEPCEACVLKLSLCYTGAASKADCLLPTTADANAYRPLFPERTKLTKPLTLRYPVPSTVQVTEQVIPEDLKVGAPIHVNLRTVVTYGSAAWTFAAQAPQYTTKIWVTTQAVSTNTGYARGGHLVMGTAAPCDVTASTFKAASAWGAHTTNSSVSFYFTRPCKQCVVIFHYRITEGTTLVADGSFKMRTFDIESSWHTPAGIRGPGEVMRLLVTTCSDKWMLAGPQLEYVNKRRPFSVTAWRTDSNGVPCWDNAASIGATVASRDGNGCGGDLLVYGADSEGHTPVHKGTATVKSLFTRACFSCNINFGGQTVSLAVLTEAVQGVVLPDAVTSFQYNSSSNKAVVKFKFYAADELGDRAYSMAGPSFLSWLPAYMQLPLPQTYLTVDTLIASTERRTSIETSTGARDVSVVQGGATFASATPLHMLDGIPRTDLLSGSNVTVAEIELTVTHDGPVYRAPLHFKLQNKPIEFSILGQQLPLEVNIRAMPESIVVMQKGQKNLLRTAQDVFEVAVVVNSGQNRYHVIDYNEGEVTMESTCSGVPTVTVPIRRGYANFVITYPNGGSESCALDFRPPVETAFAGALPQRVLRTLSADPQGSWRWAPSTSFNIVSGTGYGVTNVDHVLALMAYSTGGKPTAVAWGTVNERSITIQTQPLNCFVLSRVDLSEDTMWLRGSFPSSGGCVITTVAISEGSLPTVPSLVNTVHDRVMVMMRNEKSGTVLTGVPHDVKFEVLDSEGKLVLGDMHTKVTASKEGTSIVTNTSKSGVVTIKLELLTPGGYTFTFSTLATDKDANPVQLTYTDAPLSLMAVVIPSVLSVRAEIDGNWVPLPDASVGPFSEVSWVAGYPFKLVINAFDAVGNMPLGLHGSPTLMLTPDSVPCSNVDSGHWTEKGCYVHSTGKSGSCEDVEIPMCKQQDWAIGEVWKGGLVGSERAGQIEAFGLELDDGEVGVQRMVYVGQGEGRVNFWLRSYDNSLATLVAITMQRPRRLELLPVPASPALASNPFTFTVTVLDTDGSLVLGDVMSTVKLTAQCHTPGHTVTVGIFTGVFIEHPTGWDTRKVSRGTATFANIGFSGSCPETTLTVRCEVPDDVDYFGFCRSLVHTSSRFEVKETLRTPVPTTKSVKLPKFAIGIGDVDPLGLVRGAEELTKLEGALTRSLQKVYNKVDRAVIVVVCRLPQGVTGITIHHRGDEGVCRAVVPLSLDVCSSCVTMVEFTVSSNVQEPDSPAVRSLVSAALTTVLTEDSELLSSYPAASQASPQQTTAPTQQPAPTILNATPEPSFLSPQWVTIPGASSRASPAASLLLLLVLAVVF